MSNGRTYTKDEIRRIINKASEIQAAKETNDDQGGLNQEELLHLAGEVGIERDVLLQALETLDTPSFDTAYDWLKGTSRVQHNTLLDGAVTDEVWEEFVQEIRKVTGGIGKNSKILNTYEWEQRKQEVGYTHVSATPQKGKTRLQYVADWGALKILMTVLPFLAGSAITGIMLDGLSLPHIYTFLLVALGGTLGFGIGRVILKSFFERQKRQLIHLFGTFERRMRTSRDDESVLQERNADHEPLLTLDAEAPSEEMNTRSGARTRS